MIKRLLDWFDDRTGARQILHEALYERIPGGARWRYVWGSTLVFAFFVQVVTGVMLWTAYSPSTRTAWESVFYLQNEMAFGRLVRGIHHFAAQAMVVLLVVHLAQVVIDGAYRAPREINFWLGLILMQIVLGLGLTGYLLPWDQKGYYATQVATEIMGSTPVVGTAVQKLVQGGSAYGHHTLTRFFALHAGVLPALLVFFLVLHVVMFRRHGLTVPNPHRAPETTFWPDQVLKDGVACLAVLAAVMGLAIWKGAELSAPANPAEAYSAARPEWYYLCLFRFLKFEWVSHAGEVTGLGEAFGAVVIPGILTVVLVLMPLTGRRKFGHRFNVAFLIVVMLAAGCLTVLALYEDWIADTSAGREFRAAVEQARIDGERTVELAESPTGIPPAGAIELLRNDPLTQGPRVFEMACITCHQPAEHAGELQESPQAPELANPEHPRQVRFASREWTRSVLLDFTGHFQALSNITEENGASPERVEGASAILDGDMANWSADNREMLENEANAADVDALIEFLYAQSRRPDALAPDNEQVRRGRQIFSEGEMTAGSIDACAGCHAMLAIGDDEPLLAEEDASAPILTGYGSAGWLRRFITDPAEVYGDDNAMPAFGGQLSPAELDFLVRWLTGDYYTAPERPGSAE
jgi:quinol-cytochrome oxidoreductase complex cytochrome b subunit